MNPYRHVRRHGQLKSGYFYYLFPRFVDVSLNSPRTRDSIVVDAPPGFPESAVPFYQEDSTWRVVAVCPRDPSHRREDVEQIVLRSYYLGDLDPRFPPILTTIGTALAINDALAGHLRASLLRGVTIKRVTRLDYDEGHDLPTPPLFWLDNPLMSTTRLLRSPVLEPADANFCPQCGHRPLICPDCGNLPTGLQCPACKKRVFVSQDDRDKADGTYIEMRSSPIIVEGQLWDGSDYIRGQLVTRRFVDFLLSVHAFPFEAVPCEVDVTNMTPKQLAWLEESLKLPPGAQAAP